MNSAKQQNRIKSVNAYFESHHIVPKSLGGCNETANRVLLTAKEHFVCHVLLTKMVEGKVAIIKMMTALNSMGMISKHTKSRYMNARLYENNRNRFILEYKGENTSFFGKSHSEETKMKMREYHIGKKKSAESVQKSVISKSSGLIITPWGEFTSFLAAKLHENNFVGDNSTIKKYCTNKNNVVIKEHPQINKMLWNKIPKDLGFGFIPKENVNG